MTDGGNFAEMPRNFAVSHFFITQPRPLYLLELADPSAYLVITPIVEFVAFKPIFFLFIKSEGDRNGAALLICLP